MLMLFRDVDSYYQQLNKFVKLRQKIIYYYDNINNLTISYDLYIA